VESGAASYQPLLSNALAYYHSVRDIADVDTRVLSRQPAHLTDRNATVYATPTMRNDAPTTALTAIGGPVDVEGGWFDAGDYFKFVVARRHGAHAARVRRPDAVARGLRRRPGDEGLADLPVVTVRIGDPTEAPAVLVGERGDLGGAGRDRSSHRGLGIVGQQQ
jgi:hypothetical protein